jgi:hypothetical protein
LKNSEDRHENLHGEAKLSAVRCEMAPFFIYAAAPVILTIIIAFVFGPSLT